MARHLRVEYPGAIHHVTCRLIGDGRVEQSRLFIDDRDRERFLDRLADRVESYNIRLCLFVLMTNHFHLVFETPEANCSKFMHSPSTAYTVYYNLRHGRHGHLLDGRFRGKVVDGDEYLQALTRYVHLNPVRVAGVKNRPMKERIRYLREYRWSSYPGYIEKRKAHDFVTHGPVLATTPPRRETGRRRTYRGFAEAGLAESDAEFEEALKASPRSIGGQGFRAWVDELYEKQMTGVGAVEDVTFRHVTEPLKSDRVLEILAKELGVEVEDFRRRRRGSLLRVTAARYLIRYAGQSQREVAAVLKAGSGSAISKQLTKFSRVKDAEKWCDVWARMERQLDLARNQRHGKSINS